MKQRTFLFVCAIILLLSGTNIFGAEPQFRTLAQGGHIGVDQATNLVIRTKPEWENLWKTAKATARPTAPVPSVDFEKEMVVAVAMGQKPTGGYAITIVRVEPTPTRLKIFVVEQSPGPNSIVSQAFSAPFHFVAVPRNDLKPEFVLEKKSLP